MKSTTVRSFVYDVAQTMIAKTNQRGQNTDFRFPFLQNVCSHPTVEICVWFGKDFIDSGFPPSHSTTLSIS